MILRAQAGDIEAFMVLASRYQQPVFRLAYRLTGNREDALDVAQETMLKAFEAIKNFKLKSSFHTWVHRIAFNLTLNFLKKNRSRKIHQESLDRFRNEEEKLENFSSPEQSSISEELRFNLEKAIQELPFAYRSAFSLVVFQGMSHSEAGKVLGCSGSTVSWRMHEARKMLKEKLKPFLNSNKEVRDEMRKI